MAASRIARLALFSGPHCSLCEVGVVQHVKMSADESQHLGRQGRASQSETTGALGAHHILAFKTHRKRPARIRPRSDQHPGKRPGKVEEEISLLDTRPASRRDGGSQGSLGCLDSARSVEATRGETSVREINGIIGGFSSCFVIDTTSSIYPAGLSFDHWHSCLYDRIPGVALGEEQDELLSSAGQDLRLCFNCGSPNHAVASCPEPIDRQLVSLSRQLFNFLHPDSGGHEFTRFYVAEGWKQQRLGWLRSYKPGVIRGPLLRDALGLQEGDPGNAVEWLRNMAFWGYPPGWVGCRDPTELACYRILKDEPADGRFTTAEWSSFSIFDGIGDDEEIDLTLFNSGGPSFRTASSLTTSVSGEWTRWATYPDTHFSSTALSVHNGTPLDKVASSSSPVSVTFTPERRALWERILSGGLDTSNTSSVPPWRMPGAFGTSSCLVMEGVEDVNPPPPSSTPPPLPLTPNPPLHTFTPQEFSVLNRESALSFKSEGVIDIADDRSVVDMDVSDDSE